MSHSESIIHFIVTRNLHNEANFQYLDKKLPCSHSYILINHHTGRNKINDYSPKKKKCPSQFGYCSGELVEKIIC